MGFFEKMKAGLARTRSQMAATINTMIADFTEENEEIYDELEEALILSDAGVETTENIIENLEKQYKVLKIDAMDEALKLGNARTFNVIVLGMAARHMDFKKEDWIETIKETVPPKTVEINLKAFEKGYEG